VNAPRDDPTLPNANPPVKRRLPTFPSHGILWILFDAGVSVFYKSGMARTTLTLAQRIALQEKKLAAMKGEHSRRVAVEAGGLAGKLQRAMRILRRIERDETGDLAMWCGHAAQRLDEEIKRIAGQLELPMEEVLVDRPGSQSGG